MVPSLTVDVRGFNDTLRQYASVLKTKTWPEIVNAKALQVAFAALEETPKANVAAIRELESKEWWPKYVAKRISKGVTLRTKGGGKFQLSGKGFTREEARKVSHQILAARARSVAFIKSGWLPAIRVLYPQVRDRQFLRDASGGARQLGASKGRATAARPGANPEALIANSATGDRDAGGKGLQRFGAPALQRAIDRVKADTAQYVMRKTLEAAFGIKLK